MLPVEHGSGSSHFAHDPAGEPKSPLGFLLHTGLRFRWLVAIGVVVGAVLGFVQGIATPNLYQATGKLIFRTGIRESANPEFTIGEGAQTAVNTAQAVATELEILSSPEIYELVCDAVGVERLLSVPDPRANDDEDTPFPVVLLHQFQAWGFGHTSEESAPVRTSGERTKTALAVLRATLVPRAERGSSVIRVSFKAPDPRVARDVVNAFLDAAEAHHRNVFRSKEQHDFLQGEEKKAWDDATSAAAALKDFNEKSGIYDLANQRVALANWIDELERGIAQNRNEVSRLGEARQYLVATIGLVAQEPAELRGSIANPEYSRLQSELSALRLRRLDLERRTGETAAQFDARKRSIETAIERVQTDLGKTSATQPTPNASRTMRLGQLQSRLDEVEQSAAGLEKIIAAQQTQLAAVRKRLGALSEHGPQSEALAAAAVRQREVAENLSASLQRLGLMEMLTEEQFGNLRKLETATTPLDKVGPQRSKFLLLGSMMGAAIGMLLGFLRATTDPRLRRPSELGALGCPILAVAQQVRESSTHVDSLAGDAPPSSAHGQMLGELWERIAASRDGDAERRIAFIGGGAEVGTTTAVLAAAVGLARAGAQVLLVGPAELGPALGLTMVGGTSEPAIVDTPTKGVRALVGGEGSDEWPTLRAIESVSSPFDFILMDVGSLDSDPAFLEHLGWADSAILVVAGGRLTRAEVARRLQLIRGSDCDLLGAVFNRYRSPYPFWIPGDDPELHRP